MRGPFVSYAQNAEDVVLARALRPDEHTGFWIDVGANHPVSDSVTAAFSARGWHGINIEPLPEMYAELVSQRPLDVNLCVAIGASSGRATLYAGPGAYRGNATLVRDYVAEWQAEGVHADEIDVEVTTLADVVAAHVHGPVDFLKVDAEGFERDVLSSADWLHFRPRIVIVEATEPNSTVPSHAAWEPILLDAGYHFVLFEGLNRFYVPNEERQLAELLAVPANPLDNYVDHRLVAAVDEAQALRAQLTQTREELATTRAERNAMLATRTWRYTSAARGLYGNVRTRIRRAPRPLTK